MALKIDEQSADALTFRIAQGLHAIEAVYFGVYRTDLKWAEDVEQSLPESLQNRLTKICGENGLVEFLLGQVVDRLDEDDSLELEETKDLKDTSSYSDAIKASKELVEQLKTLPFSYRICAPLPELFSHDFHDLCSDFSLGPGISIMSGAVLDADFPVLTGIANRDKRIIPKGREDRFFPRGESLYLVQQRSGYIGQQKEAPIMADFKNALRQLLGGLLAVKALRNVVWSREKFDGYYVIHRRDDETELALVEQIAPQLCDFYTEMGRPKADSPESAKSSKAGRLKQLEALKSVLLLNDHGRRLSVAAIWYLRSRLSKDTLDALLESTIALEALLGGGNSEGTKLSNLLGNRCAYLIGKSLEDRTEILTKFNDIYTLRSKIVHEGHHKFSKYERELLVYSRELCRRALVKEMVITAA